MPYLCIGSVITLFDTIFLVPYISFKLTSYPTCLVAGFGQQVKEAYQCGAGDVVHEGVTSRT